MKRFHVHVAVNDLAQSIRFYSTIFGAAPAVVKDDYAKWMLDDPRINFAISHRAGKAGINHLGLQVESDDELKEVHGRLTKADGEIVSEQGVNCCYAKSDKHWITDPQGVAWETFRSLGNVPLYGGEAEAGASCGMTASEPSCCAPTEATGEKPRSSIAVKTESSSGCCSPV